MQFFINAPPAAPAAQPSDYRAQFGEDRQAVALFNGKRDGCFVEVGAFNGLDMSNSFLLARKYGWRGVLVEADPDLAALCRQNRPECTVMNYAAVAPGSPSEVSFETVDEVPGISSLQVKKAMVSEFEHMNLNIRRITVAAKTLDVILTEAGVREIDFLTIDVEGHEMAVLSGFTPARWKPAVMVLERNSDLPDMQVMRYMHAHGFQYFNTTGVNDWFRPGMPRTLGYRLWLFWSFYLPKWIRIDKPLRRQARRMMKSVLCSVGLLSLARKLRSR